VATQREKTPDHDPNVGRAQSFTASRVLARFAAAAAAWGCGAPESGEPGAATVATLTPAAPLPRPTPVDVTTFFPYKGSPSFLPEPYSPHTPVTIAHVPNQCTSSPYVTVGSPPQTVSFYACRPTAGGAVTFYSSDGIDYTPLVDVGGASTGAGWAVFYSQGAPTSALFLDPGAAAAQTISGLGVDPNAVVVGVSTSVAGFTPPPAGGTAAAESPDETVWAVFAVPAAPAPSQTVLMLLSEYDGVPLLTSPALSTYGPGCVTGLPQPFKYGSQVTRSRPRAWSSARARPSSLGATAASPRTSSPSPERPPATRACLDARARSGLSTPGGARTGSRHQGPRVGGADARRRRARAPHPPR
jgi:hypothetical protein